MSAIHTPEIVPRVELADLPAWRRVLLKGENLLLVIPLAAMVLLPVSNSVARIG